MFVHVSEREFFSNYTEIAVECDPDSKISQNVQNLGFWKNTWFFEKNLNFSKSLNVANVL